MKNNNNKLTLGFCFLLLQLSFYSFGQTTDKCEEYARLAVEQNEQNKRNNCGFTGNAWSSDFEKHYNWCKEVPFELALLGQEVRSNALRECTLNEENGNQRCEEYARLAVEQNEQNKRSNCGFTGNRWISDFEAHYNWCKGLPFELALFEQEERIKALGNCIKEDILDDQETHDLKDVKDISMLLYSKEIKWEFSTNYPGLDYESFELPEANCRLCEAACLKDPNCKSFTYIKPGIQGVMARCWLKSKIPEKYNDACCISGYKLYKPEIEKIWLDRNILTIQANNLTRGPNRTKLIYSNPDQQVIIDNKDYGYNELQVSSLTDNLVKCNVTEDLFGKTIDIQIFIDGIGYSAPFNVVLPNSPISIDERAVINYTEVQYKDKVDKHPVIGNVVYTEPKTSNEEPYLKELSSKTIKYMLVDRVLEINPYEQWDTTLVNFWDNSAILMNIDFFTLKPKGFRLEITEKAPGENMLPVIQLSGIEIIPGSGYINTIIAVPIDKKKTSSNALSLKIYNANNEKMFVKASIGFISSQ